MIALNEIHILMSSLPIIRPPCHRVCFASKCGFSSDFSSTLSGRALDMCVARVRKHLDYGLNMVVTDTENLEGGLAGSQ